MHKALTCLSQMFSRHFFKLVKTSIKTTYTERQNTALVERHLFHLPVYQNSKNGVFT